MAAPKTNPPEPFSDFEKLVKDMRDNQKNYFKTRKPEYLQMSKVLETRVDQYLQNKITPKLF